MNNDYSLTNVLKTLARWKKQIFIVTGIVALISIVGSLIMPNYYKSTAVLYAASPTLANPDPIGGVEKSFFTYGTGEDLDRLFAIANSNLVKDHVISKFDLATHYDIDTTSRKGKAKLHLRFNKLFETTKTKFDALQISAEDTDPKMAKSIVYEARMQIEKVAQDLIKRSQELTIKSLEEGIRLQEENLNVQGDSLSNLKEKYKIYESESQAIDLASMITTNESRLLEIEAKIRSMEKYRLRKDSINMAKATADGLRAKILKVDSILKVFNKGVLPVRLLEATQSKGVAEVSLERERLKKILASYNKPFQTVHIIEKESIAFEKSRPKRSLIVLGLSFLAFILSCLGVLLMEATKEVNWRDIYAGK